MAVTRVAINTRILNNRVTGIPRYTRELVRRFGDKSIQISSSNASEGIRGHLWEQMVLPHKVRGALLFSPCNTGPIMIEKQVLTVHDWSAMDHPEWFTRRFAAWYQFLVPKLVRRVRRVIAVSKFTQERILEATGVPEEHVIVIPNGVDASYSRRTDLEIAAMRQSLGLPSGYYILSLCSLEPRKNLHRLLKAWRIIQKDIPKDIWLVLAGGSGKSLVFRNVDFGSLPPRVWLAGYVSDEHLPALYSGALAFVYVSLYEGFGLPLLEAMACGAPVVNSGTASLPEVAGDASIMVDPYDVGAIVDNIRRLIDDSVLHEDLRQRGLNRAKLFSWDVTARNTWQVIKEAVG